MHRILNCFATIEINKRYITDLDRSEKWGPGTQKKVCTLATTLASIEHYVTTDWLSLWCYVECGSSVVKCRTRNWESPGSNPLCYCFEVWAFSFSPRCPSSLSCINGCKRGYRLWWRCEWIVFTPNCCFPEKLSWCRNEQVCQGVKCKVLWAVQLTGYCAI